ncbi:hypothetical protein CTheo_859 [Ceratobasidium theobromae]|uniref:Uncharacterized protein n=1 Tax=Ceratobasidium theobromae TaxID=1582974 RepID=A0A5N5QVL7_9AGAM|nr:hypothetical protein CTheo_859 [Ceratobasidium theobromae]
MSASTRSSTSDPPVSPVNPDEERTSAIGDNPESEPESPVVGDSALETTSHDDVTPIPQPDHQHETESRRSTRGWNVTILCCVSSGHATENDKLPVKDEKQSKKDKAKEKEERKEAKRKKKEARKRKREEEAKQKREQEELKKNNKFKEKPKKGKKDPEKERRSKGEKTAGDRKTSQSKPGATSKQSGSCLSAKPYDEKPGDNRTTTSRKSRNTMPKQRPV